MAQPTDFSEGADFISFGLSPPPEAGPSRTPASTSTSTIATGFASLPPKPVGGETSPRKGKRKISDAASTITQKDSGDAGKDKKSTKKQKKGKRDREKEKEKKKDGGGETGPKNLKEERKANERHAPWCDLVNWERCKDPAEMLNEEINAFYKYVSPTKEEFEVRLFTIELITRSLMKLWPDAEVTPFGSWQTQLYLPQGDIDLVVSNKQFSESNKARLLAEMARAMRQARITDEVAIISRARVPIIKFITNEGKLNVDISLNQVNGISASKIINQYLDSLPGSRQLILVVKSFLSQRSMNEVYTGGLGSYAVICLVISFLQVHPKLRRSELDPEENLGTLLIEFFELYGRNFNYQDVGISIRKGGYYYQKTSRGWLRPNQSFLLSVEDPQDRDNDISGGSFGIRQVKNTLAGAYELLLMRLFERADEMSGRRSGRNKGDLDPDKMSILTGVMGITKETLKQRSALHQLHSSGKLQKLLSIPFGANPQKYVTNYRPPPTLFTPKSRDRISRSARTDNSAPIPKDRGANGVGAIIVDDDEVPDDDSEFDELYGSDSDEIGPDDTFAMVKKTGSNSQSESDDDDEVQAFPGLDLKQQALATEARYGGSSDISEDEIEILDSPPEESRYSITNASTKKNKAAKTKAGPVEEDDLNSISCDSDSDSSVQYVPPPSTKKDIGVKGKERRAFWAAKGLGGGEKDNEFEDDTEFIGLD
ncbi:uncharacterized protein I303_100560 [Kwoniella dejecticola CBS 10117]|uniref:polynucleotide adenylyltransferase n=1 Tax=Kwoniella dejecticola CBS 10117 TaxID=1296121 RepID=A0A1A6AFB7_9TREE|nr:uncharacterized protein I303_00561 [Kwoniella dejecticola CBS 10117]OBR88744.1 hypothetical protein I303_00561 [Kwoniella dejecticola CBS 10117]